MPALNALKISSALLLLGHMEIQVTLLIRRSNACLRVLERALNSSQSHAIHT